MRDTRERLLTATGELFRHQGFNGTGLKEITTAADATVGSLYHFFPGGKDELADEVLRTSGRAYGDLFELIYDAASDPVHGVRDFFDGAAAVLEDTGYIDACPIGTVALEVASTNDRLRQATADVFAGWVASVVTRLEAAGIADDDAHALAVALIAGVEGGFMLSRAARSPEPMRAAGRVLAGAVESALTRATAAGPRPPARRRARSSSAATSSVQPS